MIKSYYTFLDSLQKRIETFSPDIGLGGTRCGLAIAYGVAEHFTHRKRSLVARALRQAARSKTTHPGLFIGWTGFLETLVFLGLATEIASEAINDLVRQHLSGLSEHSTLRARDVDIIVGVAGMLPRCDSATRAAGIRILQIALDKLEGGELLFTVNERSDSAEYLDLSMAHGVAGMLAMSSWLLEAPVLSARLKDVLLTHVSYENEITSIPMAVNRSLPIHGREAWCYGTPGIAAALCTAATNLEDAPLLKIGQQLLEDLDISIALETLDGFGLCHGYSGMAVCYDAVARLTGSLRCRHAAEELFDIVRRGFSTDNPEGFPRPAIRPSDDYAYNFLYGATGILAYLLVHSHHDEGMKSRFARLLGFL